MPVPDVPEAPDVPEEMLALKRKSGDIPWPYILTALLAAAAGTIATILVSRLLPEPSAGDGFTVRWLDQAGAEKRIDFGEALADAKDFAKGIRDVQNDVQIVEIRRGSITRIIRVPKTVLI